MQGPVRELVELHGGSIVAISAGRGRGATFTVSLPQLSGDRVVITDIEMPGNDGIVLLQTLRSRHNTLPAIAVSGHAADRSRVRVAAAGFNGFIAKPLDPVLLADEIVRALNG